MMEVDQHSYFVVEIEIEAVVEIEVGVGVVWVVHISVNSLI